MERKYGQVAIEYKLGQHCRSDMAILLLLSNIPI